MAEKRKLVFVQPDKEYPPFWDFEKDYGADDILKWDAEPTLEEIVRVCDYDAENCNAHDFVGTHRLLGSLLFRTVGREKATEIFHKIATFGGLHSMAGLSGRKSAYVALGVGQEGRDWDGKFKE